MGLGGPNSQSESSQLAEYSATNDAYMHYDAFRWQAGSLLVAAALVLLGFMLGGNPASVAVFGLGTIVVSLLMSVWILFAHHYRQVYLFKLHRLRELESALGMLQHRRFSRLDAEDLVYVVRGPRGHNLDLGIFVVTTLVGPVVGIAQYQWSAWMLASLPLTAGAFVTVLVNESRTSRELARLNRSSHQPGPT